jgi:uncharacterized membrane protein
MGWCMEMISTGSWHKNFTNRGFLIGPYCPIYGVAAVLMIWFLQKYENDLAALFVMAIMICSVLEYLTSYVMEKIFKARWWDYSKRTFNVNGRICLTNSLVFGILGVLLISYIHPFLNAILNKITEPYFYIISTFCFTVFIIDLVVSFKITVNLKNSLQYLRKDNTEEISKKVKQKLAESSKLFYRILKAFPNLKLLENKKKKRNFFFK